MKIEGPGKTLRIYIGESDRWGRKPLYQAIVELVRAKGMAGATVTRGLEGFGAHSRLHTARVLRLSEDLPIVVDIVDKVERIDALLPELEEMISGGLITVSEVRITKYADGSA